MSAAEHERYGDDVAAYLLGALAGDERERFERHAGECHVCHDELERLRPAAEALPRSVEQHAPPKSLKRALMKQVHSEARPSERPARRSLPERLGFAGLLRRPELAMAATAFVLVVGVVSGFAIAQLGDGRDERAIAARVDTTRVGNGDATLIAPEDGDGARLEVTGLRQPPPGQVYEIWIKRGNDIEPGPLFSVDRDGNGVGAVPGGIEGVDQVMVTRERAGGARRPSEPPVVTVDVGRSA